MTKAEKQTFFSNSPEQSPARTEHEQAAERHILDILEKHGKQKDDIVRQVGRFSTRWNRVPGFEADLQTKSDRLIITKFDDINVLETKLFIADTEAKGGWRYQPRYSLTFDAEAGKLIGYSKGMASEELDENIGEAQRIVKEYESTSRTKRLGQRAVRKLAKMRQGPYIDLD